MSIKRECKVKMTKSVRKMRTYGREGDSEVMERRTGLTQKGEIQRERNRKERSGAGTEWGVKDK